MDYLIIFILCFITSKVVDSATPLGFSDTAPCRLEDLNACGADFVIYGRDSDLPVDPQTLENACRKEISSAMCTRNFAQNCTQGIVRGVNLLAMENVVDELIGKCTPGTQHNKQYLEHAPCLNKAARDLHKCIVSFMTDVVSIAEFTAKKDKIPFICCRQYKFEACTVKAVDTRCKKAETKKYLVAALERTMSEGLDLVCRRYKKTSTKCTQDFARKKFPKVANMDGPVNLLVPLTKIISSAST